MEVYQQVLDKEAIDQGYRAIFEKENSDHTELSGISLMASKCFALLHVKFDYDTAVFYLNRAINRIIDIYDFDICELGNVLNSDTLLTVTVFVISGYEEVLVDELVNSIAKSPAPAGCHLKPVFKC